MTYCEDKNDDEIALEHTGEILVKDNSKCYIRKALLAGI